MSFFALVFPRTLQQGTETRGLQKTHIFPDLHVKSEHGLAFYHMRPTP
uniref:Uncharacterized protein n=1 Tax=Anguilla anguilla TaxID=7936 RepID=A0A0E9SI00_ANGAN